MASRRTLDTAARPADALDTARALCIREEPQPGDRCGWGTPGRMGV